VRPLLGFAILALVALALTAAPGGELTLKVALTVLTLAFFTAIGFFGYRLYRENRMTLDSLTQGQRGVLYGAVGLALLTFTATRRLFESGGAGVVVWLCLLALASYGAFWVWTRSRRYG
jgi:hypothetical protein